MKVPFHTKCACNPANGGSGICGCTMANTLVEDGNPEIYNIHITSTTCPKCSKILENEQDLYWHLKSHAENLLQKGQNERTHIQSNDVKGR